ncbi:HxlR family transcriptional regulator [Streptomyces sp. BK340]|nr:HxlR family transcriptional regulator [Streptomyces sp. BK340]
MLIWVLVDGPRRPGELCELIGGISPRVRTEALRWLDFNGLVARNSYAEAPPRAEYELSALGRTLLGPVDPFGAWVFEHCDEVMAAQERKGG